MKKKSLTFIEIMVALCIASFLLAILFPYLKETMQIKKLLEEEKKNRLFKKLSSSTSCQTLRCHAIPKRH